MYDVERELQTNVKLVHRDFWDLLTLGLDSSTTLRAKSISKFIKISYRIMSRCVSTC